mgnify:CR=1 FL=1
MDFKQIVGHEKLIEHLQNAIRMDKVSHAYIFNGEDGVGKNLMANCFSMALECEEGGVCACGHCKSCLQAISGNHPDIIRVNHEKSVISVDDIRLQLNSDILIKPYSSRKKIYIVDEAEKMNEQAQNALLKTLEEPPEYAVILLLTNNSSRFLPTILSRCITLNFKPVAKEKIKTYLMEQYQIPDYQAELSAEFSAGNLGKAILYSSSEEFGEIKDEVVHILKYLREMEYQELLEALKYFSEKKQAMDECLDLMVLWFRDVLIFKATRDANRVLYKKELSEIRSQARVISFEGLNEILEAISKLRLRLKANVNFEVAAELMLLTIQDYLKN